MWLWLEGIGSNHPYESSELSLMRMGALFVSLRQNVRTFCEQNALFLRLKASDLLNRAVRMGKQKGYSLLDRSLCNKLSVEVGTIPSYGQCTHYRLLRFARRTHLPFSRSLCPMGVGYQQAEQPRV